MGLWEGKTFGKQSKLNVACLCLPELLFVKFPTEEPVRRLSINFYANPYNFVNSILTKWLFYEPVLPVVGVGLGLWGKWQLLNM